jgi:hypothetical protein
LLLLQIRITYQARKPQTTQEATLAGTRWGGTNFRIMGIETAMKAPKEEECELMVIVTPG